jgi:uncharacterized membrane protein AbrB (regulator of aidB expression)
MAQVPDSDPTNWIAGIAGAVVTVASAVAGAYAMMRKSKTETTQAAVTTAQTTVQSTLDAMSRVIDGLTREL